MANPSLTQKIDSKELVDIGLSSIVAFTLNSSLPKSSIIKELDENIQKYKGENITDKDILLISSRISHRQLKNIVELNTLAQSDQEQFARRIKDEAIKQETEETARILKLETLFQKFEKQISTLDKERQEVKNKKLELDKELIATTDITSLKDKQINDLKEQLSEIETQRKKERHKQRQKDREFYINSQVRIWRKKTNWELLGWLFLLVFSIFFLLWRSNWSVDNAINLYKTLQKDFIIGNLILIVLFLFTGYTYRKWYDKNYNHSNIENYKKGLEIPEHLRDDE